VSPDLSPLLLRLLRHYQLDDAESSDLEQYLAAAAAAAGRDDVGRTAKLDYLDEKKRADARRCFYHAVNCF